MLLLLADGAVASYGSGLCGVLGHGSEEDLNCATIISAFQQVRVDTVSFGDWVLSLRLQFIAKALFPSRFLNRSL